MARVKVTDTGMGIPSHLLEHIFELFVQGERTLDRAEGGLGIGLTLVRRLVELHGGRITATSPGPEDAAPSPESALLSAERRAELVDALNRLRSEDREVIACRYFLDLSEEDTAAALGWKRGTVKSRLSRALDRLRAELEVGVA